MESIKDSLETIMEKIKAKASEISVQQTPSAALPDYDCPLCQDTGVIHYPEKRLAMICKCQARKRTERLLPSTKISAEFAAKTFDTFDVHSTDERVQEAYEIAREYSTSLVRRVQRGESLVGIPWLGLLGKSGSGKTHLAHAVVHPLIQMGIYPVFFNWVHGFAEWMAYHQREYEKYKVDEVRQRLYNCELLIVDDVCKEDQRDTWVREFYGIIDYRYRKQFPIIFTSEYYSELIGYLSEATASRMFEKVISPKNGKEYLGKMLLEAGEDPILLNYRLRRIRG